MKGLILFLKATILLAASGIVALGGVGLLWLPANPFNPEYSGLLYTIIAGLYASAACLLVSLFHGFRFLNSIERSAMVSERSLKAVKAVRNAVIAAGVVHAVLLPFIFLLAERDDAPGLILVGTAPVLAAAVIAAFTGVVHGLFGNVLAMQGKAGSLR